MHLGIFHGFFLYQEHKDWVMIYDFALKGQRLPAARIWSSGVGACAHLHWWNRDRRGQQWEHAGTNQTVSSFWERGARLHVLLLSTLNPALVIAGRGWCGDEGRNCLPGKSQFWAFPVGCGWCTLSCHLMSLDPNFTSKKRRSGKMIFESPLSSNALLC